MYTEKWMPEEEEVAVCESDFQFYPEVCLVGFRAGMKKTSVKLTGVRTESWTRDLSNMKLILMAVLKLEFFSRRKRH